jgi:cellulose synthase/poly-beta-1,6-N-acetylglucosamine synthase-like glycosyltransferase
VEYSVVIPARDAARTLPRVLDALAVQEPRPLEVIVVDDGSSDGTAQIAAERGARVVAPGGRSFASGARNAGWEQARGALVGCARTFHAETPWGWVAHLQVETPYLPRGAPRDTQFLSSFCLLVPRELPIRWDESYGAEDALSCAAAREAGLRLVFDPRFTAAHEHERRTFADLRRQQRRLAYGPARASSLEQGRARRLSRRLPLHYFLLLRLPVVYRRVVPDAELRRRFLALLPRLAVAEWTLGASAVRQAARRPALRGGPQPLFE